MKVLISCMECQRQAGIPSFRYAEADMNNDFYFVTTCESGHKTLTLLQEERFEVLFEFGCGALLDGYYRETVSSIAAAIERYHEFFIRVVAIQNNLPMDKFCEVWKYISNQSERQLGAFYLTYFNEFQSVPPNFVEKNAPFRNKVIHKGYIPTRVEAQKYAEDAFNYIVNSLQILKSGYADGIQKLISINLQQSIPSENKLPISTMAINSVIGLISGEEDWAKRSFDKVLNDYKYRREILERLPNHQVSQFDDAAEEAKKAIYRANFDPSNGKILSFYPTIIDYSSIPEPYIKLTYEEWQECLKNPERWTVDVDENKLVYKE